MKFIRLNITAEGQTEEKFVKNTLAMYLGKFNISTDVRRVLTSKDKRKSYRGGLISYEKAKKDIETWLKEDSSSESRFTTMFDLYGLPNDFPEYKKIKNITNPYDKVAALEKAMKEDIDDYRFIPYIQLYEFEALIFSNLRNLEYEYFEHETAIAELENQLQQKSNNPELINDNIETAPSKRILKLIPEYSKVSVGAEVAGIDGMTPLKEKCRHFREWVEKLEKISIR